MTIQNCIGCHKERDAASVEESRSLVMSLQVPDVGKRVMLESLARDRGAAGTFEEVVPHHVCPECLESVTASLTAIIREFEGSPWHPQLFQWERVPVIRLPTMPGDGE